jgi:hypothetical protein
VLVTHWPPPSRSSIEARVMRRRPHSLIVFSDLFSFMSLYMVLRLIERIRAVSFTV